MGKGKRTGTAEPGDFSDRKFDLSHSQISNLLNLPQKSKKYNKTYERFRFPAMNLN